MLSFLLLIFPPGVCVYVWLVMEEKLALIFSLCSDLCFSHHGSYLLFLATVFACQFFLIQKHKKRRKKWKRKTTERCWLFWFLLFCGYCFFFFGGVWRWGEVTGGSGSSISSWIWLWKNTKQESVDKPLHPALTLPLFTSNFFFSFF